MVETPLPYYGRKEVVHALYISHHFSQPQQTTLLLRLERGFSKTKVECIISMKDEGILMEDTELILKAIAQINNNIEQLDGKIDNLREDVDKKIDDLRENMETEFFAVHREIDNVYQLAKKES